jgi:hypothetical protein
LNALTSAKVQPVAISHYPDLAAYRGRIGSSDARRQAMQDVKQIAEGLTEAQRAALVAGKWATPEFHNLFLGRGISKRRKGTFLDVELTPLGLAVRNHLKGLPNDQ